MTIELLDTENDDGNGENVTDAEKWSSYVERYADSSAPNALGSDHRKSRDSNNADHSDQEQDGVNTLITTVHNRCTNQVTT